MAQFHTPRGSHTRIVSHCMTQPQMLFLTQHAMQPILVVIQNGWYDEECHDTRRCLQRDVTRGIYTHKQARATFQHLVRKKKRLYLAKFENHLYRLFLGEESKRGRKMSNETHLTKQMASIHKHVV